MSLCRDIRNSRTSAPSTNDGDGNLTRNLGSEQRQLFFGSPTPTPSHGLRRRRMSNDFDRGLEDDVIMTRPAGTVPITPGTTKRLKASCDDTARLFDVDANQLKSFAEVCKPFNGFLH